MAESSILRDGIYPPLPTFFDEQDELDLVTLQKHIQRLAQTGITGYVVMGTNGEAVHLTSEERAQIIETAREVCGVNTPLLQAVASNLREQPLQIVSKLRVLEQISH